MCVCVCFLLQTVQWFNLLSKERCIWRWGRQLAYRTINNTLYLILLPSAGRKIAPRNIVVSVVALLHTVLFGWEPSWDDKMVTLTWKHSGHICIHFYLYLVVYTYTTNFFKNLCCPKNRRSPDRVVLILEQKFRYTGYLKIGYVSHPPLRVQTRKVLMGKMF